MTILIDTRDKSGLVNSISSVISSMGCNIQSNHEFVDKDNGHFFMRTRIHNMNNVSREDILMSLKKHLPSESNIKIFGDNKKSIVIFCSKEAHCLGDILIKHEINELNVEIRGIISNHDNLRYLANKFSVPYFHISHNNKDWIDQITNKCQELDPSLIILAKYMQILPPVFVNKFYEKIINIHHSFLPAFIGANPYKQAYERGVKIIGATAHFVNDKLDAGPIIYQDIMQVDHTFSWRDMQKAGRNIERIVLAKALELAIDNRIFIYKNKTIVF